jgi:hypothetical protein
MCSLRGVCKPEVIIESEYYLQQTLCCRILKGMKCLNAKNISVRSRAKTKIENNSKFEAIFSFTSSKSRSSGSVSIHVL